MYKSNEKMKPLHWLGSTKKDLTHMPDDVQSTFGYALYLAQTGGKHEHAKPLKGFGSAGRCCFIGNCDGESAGRPETSEIPTSGRFGRSKNSQKVASV